MVGMGSFDFKQKFPVIIFWGSSMYKGGQGTCTKRGSACTKCGFIACTKRGLAVLGVVIDLGSC